MSTTRLELRTSLRQVLPDTAQWPDAALNQWIDEAIADYSSSFRLRREAGFLAYAHMNTYELAFGGKAILDVLTIEYPVGEPRTYLPRLDRQDPRFYQGRAYDIYYDGQSERAWMLLSFFPPKEDPGGFYVTYETVHPKPIGDDAALTVPDQHLDLLRLFVTWKALQKLEAAQAVASLGGTATPDFLPVLSALGLSAARAGQMYQARLSELNRQKSDGGIVPWCGAAPVY